MNNITKILLALLFATGVIMRLYAYTIDSTTELEITDESSANQLSTSTVFSNEELAGTLTTKQFIPVGFGYLKVS